MIWAGDEQRRRALDTAFRMRAGWRTGAPPEIESLLATLDDSRFPGAVLPCIENGSRSYMAIADSWVQWRQLAPLLGAAVGVTLTDFDPGQPAPADHDDLAGWFMTQGLMVIRRFSAGGEASREARVLLALRRLRALLTRAPVGERDVPRSTDELLDDLELTLTQGDRANAVRVIRELDHGRGLDALNHWFLEVRLRSAFGEWEDLIGASYFADLCLTRRPPLVSAAMLQALYRTSIEPAEIEGGVVAARTVYREHLHGRMGTLCETPLVAPERPSATMLLLAALERQPVDRAAIERLGQVATAWQNDDRAAWEPYLLHAATVTDDASANAPLIDGPEIVTSDPSWSGLFRVLDQARDGLLTPTPTGARTVLLAATHVQTLEAYSTAASYVGCLSPAERAEVLAHRAFAALWLDVEERTAGGSSPRNWLEWLSLLPSLSAERARALARQGAHEWCPDALLVGEESATMLAAALEGVEDPWRDRVEAALPYLVGWVQRDPAWPREELLPLYESLLLQLVLGDRRTEAMLGAIRDLCDGILRIGLSAAQYRDLLRNLSGIIEGLAAVQHLDWLLDLAEISILHGCPAEDARVAIWTQIAQTLHRFSGRLTTHQTIVARDLATLLGAADSFGMIATDTLPPPVQSERRRPLRVAVYTLVDGLGSRLRDLTQRIYPWIRLEVTDDEVNTPQLTELARHADVFVICWRAATHAATTAIRSQRPSDKLTIYAGGKGTSSILAELGRALDAGIV